MKKSSGIYIIKNNINNKIYVGQTINFYTRWRNHKYHLNKGTHNNYYLQHAWDKYGEQNFIFKIIEECPKENLNEREIYWIKKLNTYVHDEESNGYNLTIGGEILFGENNPMYGRKHKLTSKRIMREKALNRKSWWLGKHLSETTKYKISKAKKRLVTSRNKQVICINTGEVFNFIYEAKDKYNINGNTIIQECCKGRYKSAGKHPETGEPLRWMYYNDFKNGKEIDTYKNESCTKVICLNTGEIFDSLAKAAEKFQFKTHSPISKCCRGKSKTGGKHPITGERLVWMYYDQYIKQAN
jgi:group I intron endonuclease